MKYYRVRPEYDNKTRYRWNGHRQAVPAGILIGDELYTATELKRIANCPEWFEEVEMSKHKTYKCFGARFAM